jgi:endonuclease/exonuclease/phosphatase family metal-dependent hydrolase
MRPFLLFIFFWIIISCSSGDKALKTEKPVRTDLKIMTYNIHHGVPLGQATDDVHIDKIAEVINNQVPDLVALQEVDSVTKRATLDEAKKLAKLTGMNYFYSKTIDYEGGKYGDAILSRFPILDRKSYSLPMPDTTGEKRGVAIITIKLPSGTKINFASTHLDIKSNRIAQIKVLNKLSQKSNFPLILAGDFNADPNSEGIQILQREYVLLCNGNCPLTASISGSPKEPHRTIDWIVLNPAAAKLFHTISYKAEEGVYASDHLPLIANIEEK